MPSTNTISEQIKEIKQSFRQLMDGSIAQWGITSLRLREKADEIGKNYDLAIALWKENVRECKILATMIMPADEILPEVVDIWMEQTETIEIAEQAAMNLYQYLPYAPAKAYEWIASDRELNQLCGFHVLSRLFTNGQEPNERGINEFLDQVHVALLSPNISVRKAALNSLNRFANLGIVYERLAESILRRV